MFPLLIPSGRKKQISILCAVFSNIYCIIQAVHSSNRKKLKLLNSFFFELCISLTFQISKALISAVKKGAEINLNYEWNSNRTSFIKKIHHICMWQIFSNFINYFKQKTENYRKNNSWYYLNSSDDVKCIWYLTYPIN